MRCCGVSPMRMHCVTRSELRNVDNVREVRGGFSVYVPEYYDPAVACPVIVALHGGSGHGADFLWTGCVRRARAAAF